MWRWLIFMVWAGGATAQDLGQILGEASDGPHAAVLCVYESGATRCETSGHIRPGARAVSPNDRFAIASVGKTVTAVAVLQLVQTGRLGLDDPASKWLPPKHASSFNGITVRHLLTMQSGIQDYYTDD